jgi:hypothetical protein
MASEQILPFTLLSAHFSVSASAKATADLAEALRAKAGVFRFVFRFPEHSTEHEHEQRTEHLEV